MVKKKEIIEDLEEESREEETEVVIPAQVTRSVDLDTYSDNLSSEQIEHLYAPRKTVSKPDISGLPNAIGPDGFPVFVKGDRIVIERYTSFLQGNPYLDTRTYRVEAVDLDSGRVALWDEELSQYATDNWRHGVKIGQIYKLSLGRLVSSKGKRGRPRKEASPTPTVITSTNQPEKRGRGRPKGSKNQSSDTKKIMT